MMAAVREAERWLYGRTRERKHLAPLRVPELCRQRLLHCAESFEELAKSFEEPEWLPEAAESPVRDRQETLDEKRQMEHRVLLRHNLNEMAQIMLQLADELQRFRPMEEHYRKMIRHALRAESIFADHFCYLADREEDAHAICMTLYTDKKGGCQAARVADLLSVLLGRPLQTTAGSPYRIDDKPHSFVFVEEAHYVVLTGFGRATKETEQVSGDHYAILESEKGKLTLLMSDGTGSGERASLDSEKVLDLAEKFLEAGYAPAAAADMINVAFYAGERDLSHPTFDLCELDLYDGRCRFLKVGGAVSFLKRGDQVTRIEQGTLPLGVFQKIEAESVELQVRSGDYIILMTDGVLDALPGEDCIDAMEAAIAGLAEVSPAEIADTLMELALHGCEGHIRDDMTVLVAGIWENAADSLAF